MRILSDHGSQFTSALWKTRLNAENMKKFYIVRLGTFNLILQNG